MSACSSCGATIFWVNTVTGKLMPLDAKPSEEGEWSYQERGGRKILVSFDEAQHSPSDRHQTHWAVCPYANQHRKPR